MNSKLAITYLMVAAALVPAAGFCGDPDSDRSNPSAFVKDSEITAKIKAKLAAEHPSSLARIHVDTDANGAVRLTGSAESKADISKAVSIAFATEGVVSVTNDIKLEKGG